MDIIEHIKELVRSYLEENNIELVDVIYRREQGGMTMRLLVDTADGVTLDECEAVNDYLSGVLDRDDVIKERYVLEVSSPGLDRPLKTDRDFERTISKSIEVTTYQPVDSRKTHDGRLIGLDKEKIVIENNGKSAVIPRSLIAMARLKIDFE